jgi:Cyclic nucleotide-binding domain
VAGETRNIRPKMNGNPVKQSLLSELQGHLSADLFTGATLVRRAAYEVLFVAGDAGNGCYRVEEGLVKVTMMSRAGVERILAILGPSAIVGELAIIDGRPRSARMAYRPADGQKPGGRLVFTHHKIGKWCFACNNKYLGKSPPLKLTPN